MMRAQDKEDFIEVLETYIREINTLHATQETLHFCLLLCVCIALFIRNSNFNERLVILLGTFLTLKAIRAYFLLYFRNVDVPDYLAWYLLLGLTTTRYINESSARLFITQNEFELDERLGCFSRLIVKWRKQQILAVPIFTFP